MSIARPTDVPGRGTGRHRAVGRGAAVRGAAVRGAAPAADRAAVAPDERTAAALGERAAATGPDREAEIYLRVQGSPEFQQLRRGYRRFAFPLTAAFLAWYLLCLLLSTLSPRLMAHPVAGSVNVAMVLGLAQFVTTFGVCLLVARTWAGRRDAMALELRWRTQQELR